MRWAWFAGVDNPPPTCLAAAPVTDPAGGPAGHLAVWAGDDEARPADAHRIDGRAVQADGGPLWLSLALAPAGVTLAFDDPMVSGALRRRLERPWPGLVSTLLVDWARIGGAVTGGTSRQSVADDPFARLFPARLLRLGPGLLGPVPAPTGPAISRYGSGNPWPYDRYAGQVR